MAEYAFEKVWKRRIRRWKSRKNLMRAAWMNRKTKNEGKCVDIVATGIVAALVTLAGVTSGSVAHKGIF